MNTDIPFKKIDIQDKQWVDPLLALSDYRGTEYCFTTLYIWADHYGSEIARMGDLLILRSVSEGEASYLFPAGKGEIKEALLYMESDALKIGKDFSLMGLTAPMREEIERLMPGRYSFTPVRNSFDYIYDREDLATLKGKKFQPKRNFISRFKSLPDWSYESISSDDPEKAAKQIEEAMEMTRQWCILNGCIHNSSMKAESCAVRRALTHFAALGLEGGMLRVEGRPVAYTIGEPLNSDTYIIHVEKAFSEYKGVYQAINHSFINDKTSGFRYINREDDAGDEGLRQAKLSYHPSLLLEKYLAIKK